MKPTYRSLFSKEDEERVQSIEQKMIDVKSRMNNGYLKNTRTLLSIQTTIRTLENEKSQIFNVYKAEVCVREAQQTVAEYYHQVRSGIPLSELQKKKLRVMAKVTIPRLKDMVHQTYLYNIRFEEKAEKPLLFKEMERMIEEMLEFE